MKKSYSTKIPYQPNKGLGQNFLFEQNYLQKIVEKCLIEDDIIIIEIGSGYGSLTNLLAKTSCQKVIGLEKDKKLFQ
jgi:16S rRNA (adenine1518-N6/adenine1519-N6)-dimethyltransferase